MGPCPFPTCRSFASTSILKLKSGPAPLNSDIQRRFFIDEQHSHFIFVHREEKGQENAEQMLTLDLMYQLSFESTWTEANDVQDKRPSKTGMGSQGRSRIPFVGLLMQGDRHTCAVVHEYLVKQVPVVVLQGSGGFADLLYFAYNELRSLRNRDDLDRLLWFDLPSDRSESVSLDIVSEEESGEPQSHTLTNAGSSGLMDPQSVGSGESSAGRTTNRMSSLSESGRAFDDWLEFSNRIDYVDFLLEDQMPRSRVGRATSDTESFCHSKAYKCADHVLTQRILRVFPDLARSADELDRFRLQLINCVRHSMQEGVAYLSFLCLDSNDKRLTRLDEFLLAAYIRCSRHYQPDSGLLLSNRQMLNQNLTLTLDWNCPNIAREETARHAANGAISIDKSLMQLALFQPARQEFVQIFMEVGFKVGT